MGLGPSATIANTLVDSVTGAGGGGWLQFHVGDPGAAGTANQAGSTTRIAKSHPAASSGTSTQTGTATLASWAGGSQNLSHWTEWSASSAGTFRGSGAFSTPRAVVNGDTLNVSGIVWSATAAS
jgi:hypothetical protein